MAPVRSYLTFAGCTLRHLKGVEEETLTLAVKKISRITARFLEIW